MTAKELLKCGYDHACAELRRRGSFQPFAALGDAGSTPRILFAEDGSVETLRAAILSRRAAGDGVELVALFAMGAMPPHGGGAARRVISVHLEGQGQHKVAVTPYELVAGELRLFAAELFAEGKASFLGSV